MIVEVTMTAKVHVPDDVQGAEKLVEEHLLELFPDEWYEFRFSPAPCCRMVNVSAVTACHADNGSAGSQKGPSDG